jgi:predicted ATPase
VSEVFIKKGKKEILLADLGYGFSQLIPIILKIRLIGITKLKEDNLSIRLWPTVFLLEEPEANLHPSLQSKLAEFIILAATEFNIQFIIETHSEYMIRNFQYLTAKKEINPWDTQIFYFNHPESEEFSNQPVKEIDILSDGRLSSEFGEGFFDEIPRLLAFLYNSSSN